MLTTLGGASLIARERQRSRTLFGPGKPVALLAYLASAPRRTASRERVMDLLWSDRTADAAQHDLRQTLWYIRRRLGRDAIAARHGDLVLSLAVRCDRDAFLAALEGGREERALALYRGDFLPGVSSPGGAGFDEWANLERYRLRRAFCRAAESLTRAATASGKFTEALRLARRGRDAHPEDEGGWRLLLETLLAAGEQRRAASEADVLEWQLALAGREPEPATRDALRRARRRATPHDGRPIAGITPRLVGREPQLAVVLQAWEGAKRRHGRHVDLVAPAGFGKTRLLKEARSRLQALGARVLYVAANPATRAVPHVLASDIATALCGLPGSAAVSTAAAASLLTLSPALASRFSVAPDPAVGEEAVRRRLLALLELLHAVSEEQPCVLLLDDVHWADSRSRQILEGMLGRVDGSRTLIVTAARPAPAHALTPNARVLHLPALTVDDVRALIAGVGALPDEPWGRDLPARLRSIAGGSPLVLLEMLEQALEREVLILGRQGWSCPDSTALFAELDAIRANQMHSIDSHPRSLLVLPFEARGAEHAKRYCDGLTENIIDALSRIRSLRVIAWPSVRRLRGADKDAAELSAELNARYVFRGGVRARGTALDISAQLTDAMDGSCAWEDSCTVTIAGLSDIEQRYARAVADALLVTLTPAEEERIRRRAIPHPDAYDCHLRAREAMSRDTGEGYARAVSLLRTGLRIGGENAALYATLGTAYARYGMQMLENERTRRRSEACARKALELDPESAEAHFLTGLVRCRRGDIQTGVRDMLRALAINPTHTDALYWVAGWLGTLGKPELARPLAQRLLEVDPLTPTNVCIPGWTDFMAGRFEEATHWYHRWVEVESGSPIALHVAAAVLIWSQRFDEARVMLDRLTATAPASPLALFNPFIVHALNHDRALAAAAFTPPMAAAAASYEITCWQMGSFHALIDARSEAIDWVERAVQRGFLNYPMLAEYDPFLRRLDAEPRFARLLARVKTEWESLQL